MDVDISIESGEIHETMVLPLSQYADQAFSQVILNNAKVVVHRTDGTEITYAMKVA